MNYDTVRVLRWTGTVKMPNLYSYPELIFKILNINFFYHQCLDQHRGHRLPYVPDKKVLLTLCMFIRYDLSG